MAKEVAGSAGRGVAVVYIGLLTRAKSLALAKKPVRFWILIPPHVASTPAYQNDERTLLH